MLTGDVLPNLPFTDIFAAKFCNSPPNSKFEL